MEEAFRLFKSTREYFTPVLTQSAFYDKGMLTPDEFVRAGDHLVRTCLRSATFMQELHLVCMGTLWMCT